MPVSDISTLEFWNLINRIVLLISQLPDIVQKSFCTPYGAMDLNFQMNYVPAFWHVCSQKNCCKVFFWPPFNIIMSALYYTFNAKFIFAANNSSLFDNLGPWWVSGAFSQMACVVHNKTISAMAKAVGPSPHGGL